MLGTNMPTYVLGTYMHTNLTNYLHAYLLTYVLGIYIRTYLSNYLHAYLLTYVLNTLKTFRNEDDHNDESNPTTAHHHR